MYMLSKEYIIYSMASQCVSAISALHPSIAAGSAKTSLMDQDFKIDFLSHLNRALN